MAGAQPQRFELGADDTIGPGGGWLYESPLWDHRRQVFLWVDIEAGDVHEFDPARSAHTVHRLHRTVACVALRSSGGYVLALRNAIAVTDDFASISVVHEFTDLPDDVRFNDGAVAPDGSLWAGTLSHTRDAAGTLYRIDPDRRIETMLEGVSISNGMDWHDGRHLYVDSGPGTIDILGTAVGADGRATIVSRQPYFRAGDGRGSPDGLTIDSEGCAWVALWGAGRVVRLSPAGTVLVEVAVPAPHTSSVAFGGADLQDLYITTAREELTADQLQEFPLSGSVFCFRNDVSGRVCNGWLG